MTALALVQAAALIESQDDQEVTQIVQHIKTTGCTKFNTFVKFMQRMIRDNNVVMVQQYINNYSPEQVHGLHIGTICASVLNTM